jgi:tRNA pseudouridine55 synthase
MEGTLLVDKPEGWTSFDVCNYIRRMIATIEGKKPKNIKVGHTGTLDPAATGLLVICVGKATKKIPELIKQDKTYEVEITLGKVSTTGDKEGEIEDWSANWRMKIGDEEPNREEVENCLESFVGEIQQIPPAYSAIKVNGKRAYQLAREGKQFDLKPRAVKINSITSIEYDYPKIKFIADVGSGTYIRSLSQDIGEKLGTGAYMSALNRTRIGDFKLTNSIKVADLTAESLQKTLVS